MEFSPFASGWVEGTRLSDRQRGWAPEAHLETIVSNKTRTRNLLDTMRIATAAMWSNMYILYGSQLDIFNHNFLVLKSYPKRPSRTWISVQRFYLFWVYTLKLMWVIWPHPCHGTPHPEKGSGKMLNCTNRAPWISHDFVQMAQPYAEPAPNEYLCSFHSVYGPQKNWTTVRFPLYERVVSPRSKYRWI